MSTITGISSLFALSAALALMLSAERMEFSWRTGYAAAMAAVAIWCFASSLHGDSTVLEMLLMLLMAIHALRAIRDRKTISTIKDCSPFK